MHRFSRFSVIRRSRKVENASRSSPSHNVTCGYLRHSALCARSKPEAGIFRTWRVPRGCVSKFRSKNHSGTSRGEDEERGSPKKKRRRLENPPFLLRSIRGKRIGRVSGRISRLVYLKSRTSWTHNARIVTPGIQISRGASLIDGDGIGGDDAPDTRDISSERNTACFLLLVRNDKLND